MENYDSMNDISVETAFKTVPDHIGRMYRDHQSGSDFEFTQRD